MVNTLLAEAKRRSIGQPSEAHHHTICSLIVFAKNQGPIRLTPTWWTGLISTLHSAAMVFRNEYDKGKPIVRWGRKAKSLRVTNRR